jgi:hypothetical protein
VGHLEAVIVKTTLLEERVIGLEANAAESKGKVQLKKDRFIRSQFALCEVDKQLHRERSDHRAIADQTKELGESIVREQQALTHLKTERAALEELERQFWGLRVAYAERLSDWLL